MPSLNLDIFDNIKEYNTSYRSFIETGTFLGDTICSVNHMFDHTSTVDLSERLLKISINNYNNYCKNNNQTNKAKFYLGDSSVWLKQMIQDSNQKSVIFLDAHWSCGPTARGEIDVPLYSELLLIKEFQKHECIIIIDDVRLFGTGPTINNEPINWENVNEEGIIKTLQDRITSHYFLPSTHAEKDRFIIHLKEC